MADDLVYSKINFAGKGNEGTSSYDLVYSPGDTPTPDMLIEAAKRSLTRLEEGISEITNENIDYVKRTSMLASKTFTVAILSTGGSVSSPDDNPSEGTTPGIRDSFNSIYNQIPSSDTFITLPVCKGYSVPLSIVGNYSPYIGTSILAVYFQRILLSLLSSEGAVSAMLAIGFLLRSNPFTRGAGAFFIALGLSMYSILPFSILIINDSVNAFFSSYVSSSTNNLLTLVSDSNEAFKDQVENFYESITPSPVRGERVNDIFSGVGLALQLSGCHYGNDIEPNMLLLSTLTIDKRPNVMLVFLFMVILAQALSLLAFVSITGGLAKAFGEEISPYVIGRLTRYLR